MNAVIGMSALLATTELDAEQAEYLGSVRSSAEVLLATINDVLDFSKLETGNVTLEESEDLGGLLARLRLPAAG